MIFAAFRIDLIHAVQLIQWVFLAYFIGVNLVYIMLNIVSLLYIRRYTNERDIEEIPPFYSAFTPPISIIVPAYNEETTIVASLRALFQIVYPDYEIIVVNDGSTDRTLEVLIEEFRLIPLPAAYTASLQTARIKSVYASTGHYNLRVIDKENGGKSDSLNAGISLSDSDLVCCVDADSILQPDSLIRVVQPFIEDPKTIASGGTIRIANGCQLENGYISKVGLPHKILPLIQVVEYLRAFLLGRLGWSAINALLIISGAFSVFKKEAVLAVGGYRTDTVGEDMEMVLHLHHHYRLKQEPYRITFVPDPICWTEVPEDWTTLRNQRTRWQRGLGESLLRHRKLMFHPRSGLVGWLAMPSMVIFELFSPVLELTGYVFMIVGFLFGIVSFNAFAVFLVVAVGMGLLLSLSALLLEEMSFHVYANISDVFRLLGALILENMGYRQLTLLWRAQGLWQWCTKKRHHWGEMRRSASYAVPPPLAPNLEKVGVSKNTID
jgi:cellulose synthase/poly-beta-1,6-N-acetylglucosamine synthase-like glycosyltransferase